MGLANCKECGKVYMQNLAGLCPDCYKVQEDKELQVAHYLQDHGQASISEIREATGVSETTILKMLRKGRISGEPSASYPSGKGGKPILEGRSGQEGDRRPRGMDKPSSSTRPVQQPRSTSWKGEGVHTTFNKKK